MTAPLDATQSNPKQGGASFPLRHRLLRLAWSIVWGTLGKWTPAPFHGWRRFLIRLFGAKLHPTAKVYPGVSIWYPPNLTMGPYSCLAPGVYCYCMAEIRLEAYALVSQRAHLCAGTHDIDDPHFQLYVRPIHLGENAWVAAEAFVGPGRTIGDRAVLGARAVLFKDLPADAVAIGNPANIIRQRRLPKQPGGTTTC